MGAAAVEPDDWAIDQAIAEHAMCSASGRLSVAREGDAADDQVQRFSFPWEGGEVQLCGAPADEAHWTVAYVPEGGEVITPLAIGAREVVTATWARIRDAIDPREVPPPRLRFGGDVRRHFRPAHGRFLVGVAQEGASTILLAALGEQLAVVLLEGRRRVVLDVKAPLDLREVDVDRMRRFLGLGAARAAEPRVAEEARVSSATQAHHIRITHGLPTDVPGGPSIPDVVWRCFKGLMSRAMALRCEPRPSLPDVDPVPPEPAEPVGPTAQEPAEQPARRKGKRRTPTQKPAKRPARLKGKKYVRPLLRALFLCSLKGSLDLVGGTGVLLPAIQKHDPSFKITLEALADVLNLLRATGTCLVTRPDDERIWHIHLVGLNDASSTLHRRLLEETPIPFRFPAAATNEVLAEDDEPTPTANPPTPGSSGTGADKREPGGGGKVGEPAAEDVNTADAASARRRATAEEHEAGAGEKTAAGAAATSSDGERTEGPASTALARLLLLAVILAAWQAAMVQVTAVTREFDELRTRVASLLATLAPPVERERAAVTAEAFNPEKSAQHIEAAQPQRYQVEFVPPREPGPHDPLAPDGVRPPADERHDAETGADGDPAIGLTEAFDLPRVDLSALTCVQAEADLLVGPEPPQPPPPRAYFEVAGFLAWTRWLGATRRSLGGLVPLERDDDRRQEWFGNDYGVCATASMPRGSLALGVLGARGPPHLRR